jgi:hypothetical protein
MGGVKGLGGVFAFLATVAFVASAFLPWVGDVPPTQLPLQGLWEGYDASQAGGFATSLAMALLFVAFVFLASAAAQSRALAALGVLFGGTVLTLWAVQSKGLRDLADFVVEQTGYGAWVAAGGLLCGVVAVLLPRTITREL